MKKNLKEILTQINARIADHFTERNITAKIFDENDREIVVPGVLLDIEEITDGQDRGDEMAPLDCTVSAYCVLATDTPDLQAALRDFAAEVLTLARQNNWGLTGQATMPGALRAVPADFAPRNPKVESWVVEWNQTFYLGNSVWDTADIVPTTVLISYNDEEYTELDI